MESTYSFIAEELFGLVLDERYLPSTWSLGRILEVYIGKDEHIRVVTIKTHSSTYN